MEEEKKEAVIEPTEEVDVIAAKDAEIAKLSEERDNYKEVALKRLGKLPADNVFMGETGKDVESIIEEKVKAALIDKEIARKELERTTEINRITKENSELRLALKNRPGGSLGDGSGGSTEVKDNVFSEQQLVALRMRATRLKADPDKFIENAKKNLMARS